GSTRILLENGVFRKLEDFRNGITEKVTDNGSILVSKISPDRVMSFSKERNSIEPDSLVYFMEKENAQLFKLTTSSGLEIEATEDHPFMTKGGMVPLKELQKNSEIAVSMFEGVEWESPSEEIIIFGDEFDEGVKNELKKRDLIPLRMSNKKLPILARVFGYLLGDGNIYFPGEKGRVVAYGKKEDLERMKADLALVGYTASVYSRERHHKITDQYGVKEFESLSHELHVSSKSLATLLIHLGMPLGKKASTRYHIPEWIKCSSRGTKRQFLAGLFGAELSSPRVISKTCFQEPVLSQNKNKEYVEGGRWMMVELSLLLKEFGIRTAKISTRKEYRNKQGETFRVRLSIASEEENLLKLYRDVGFEYNRGRHMLADIASMYILRKDMVTAKRGEMSRIIKDYREMGLTMKEVKRLLQGSDVNERFMERHYYEDAKQRINLDFVSFEEFCSQKMGEFERYGMLFDMVDKIEKAGKASVYDFNVEKNHNFVANGFIVSNCGVRLLRTNLVQKDLDGKMKDLLEAMFRNVPSGLGSSGKVKIKSMADFDDVLNHGAKWAVERGYGWERDLKHLEDEGNLKAGDASKISSDAKRRGMPQLGSLGAGNHFLEIQRVEKVFNPEAAKAFGLEEGKLTVMIHTGSRGLGHQACSDYLRDMERLYKHLIQSLPDRELVYAPAQSKLANDYFAAMSAAANFAWCNRQMIVHWTRESFQEVLKQSPEDLGMDIVYDVAHNIAKVEEHVIDGKKRKVYTHRKGATRAFGPGRSEIPMDYRLVGQPVIIPGSMGTASYVLVGSDTAMEQTFGSTAHGAGRAMSRTEAVRTFRGQDVADKLKQKGILIRSASWQVVAEEAPSAYKDIDEVARVSDEIGIGKLVARLVPIGVVKG
ncbi:hypothetical protein A3K63_04275, partial [Candidatus Micrarchaeota archaeon RBG_16_49_10]